MVKDVRKKRRRKGLLLKVILIIIFLIALFAVIAFKVFTVEKVVVEGNKLYEQDIIENAILNDEYSWNSLYVFVKYKFVDTEEIPFIDTMEISLLDPHTIRVNVYEKGMMGYLYIPGISENAYFDKDGLVIETSSQKIKDVPQIKGIDCDTVVLYEKLPIDSDILKGLLTLTQTLKRNKLVPDMITYNSSAEAKLTYGKVQVEIGKAKLLTQKVERIAAIIPKLKGQSGTLHLENWTEDSTNIVFDKHK